MVRFPATLPAAVLLASMAACSSSNPIKCATDDDCLQGRIAGKCLPSPTSAEHWCAFSDPGCADSSLRWGVKSGDDLAGECVAGDTTTTLSVEATGEGTGHVISDPAGIDCPGTCSASFAVGATVKLTAKADDGSFFDSWGAPCSGFDCSLTIAAATTVEASFLISGSTRSVAAFDHFLPQLFAADGSIIGYQPRSATVIQVQKLKAGDTQPMWTTPVIGFGDSEDINGMAQLAGGDIVVAAGGVSGIGGLAITDPDFALVARLDAATGAPRWVVGFPMEDTYVGKLLVVDTANNTYFAGSYRGTTTIGGFQLHASDSNDKNVFVAKLDGAGHFVWVIGLGGTAVDLARSLAMGEDGLPVVLLQTSGPTDLGTGTIGGFGGIDCAIAKVAASDGHELFTQVIGSTNNDECFIAGASAQNSDFAVAVGAGGPVKVGAETLLGPGTVVIGYSAAGVRNRAFGSASSTISPTGLTFVADRSFWLTGSYTGSVTLGGTPLPAPSGSPLGFVAHVSLNSEHLFSASIGGSAAARGDSVYADDQETTVVGYFFGLATFGDETLAAGDKGSGFAWSLVP